MKTKYITVSNQGLSLMSEFHSSLAKAISHAQGLLKSGVSTYVEISKEVDDEIDSSFVSFRMIL